ncbi:hypothetical protein CHARACLAT_012475 [Characodon lateralis]|uniref:Uncharacterized protein n=1 Tax=Characodon lateralis TaxID=208331 RepID=A0ABU7DHU1_9TELE|nr:hypothetical protein [Characodon lateralis]
MSESGCLRARCFLFPPLGAVELEDRRCDRCSSLIHQFRGLYEGGSPALLHLSVFALRGTSALLLVGDLKKTSDHSLDFGFIPCSGPPRIPLCLVKQTLSTLLRFLLDHQEAPTESALLHCPRLATISPLADPPHLNIRRPSWKLHALYISQSVDKFFKHFSV